MCIVNNAGVMPLSPLEEPKIDEWNRMIDVNIRGVLHGIAAGLPDAGARHRTVHQHVVDRRRTRCGRRPRCTARPSSPSSRSRRAFARRTRDIRVTVISPGVTESELAKTISDASAREAMRDYRQISISPYAIARAIAFAIDQPEDVDISEIIVRPTASPY